MATQPQSEDKVDSVVHAVALARLERELREFIRSRPLLRLEGTNKLEQEPYLADAFNRTSDECASRVYSRSAVQRAVLQELAKDLHGSLEKSRTVQPLHHFVKAFDQPDLIDVNLIDPFVEDAPARAPDSVLKRAGTVSGTRRALGFADKPDLGTSDVPLLSKERSVDQRASVASQPLRRQVLDMCSYPNISGTEFIVYKYNPGSI